MQGRKSRSKKQKKKQKYAWESQDDISRSVFIPESVHDDKRNVDGNASGERKTNKVWIDGKTIYRKVINFGALPNATKKDVAHNISNLEQFIRIEGVSTRQDNTKFSQSLPLIYKNIESNYNTSLGVDVQTVSIQTNEDRSMFNGYVILEYTKTTEEEV